jgi:hypothetical protein
MIRGPSSIHLMRVVLLVQSAPKSACALRSPSSVRSAATFPHIGEGFCHRRGPVAGGVARMKRQRNPGGSEGEKSRISSGLRGSRTAAMSRCDGARVRTGRRGCRCIRAQSHSGTEWMPGSSPGMTTRRGAPAFLKGGALRSPSSVRSAATFPHKGGRFEAQRPTFPLIRPHSLSSGRPKAGPGGGHLPPQRGKVGRPHPRVLRPRPPIAFNGAAAGSLTLVVVDCPIAHSRGRDGDGANFQKRLGNPDFQTL